MQDLRCKSKEVKRMTTDRIQGTLQHKIREKKMRERFQVLKAVSVKMACLLGR
jgi:hypothetical protein